MQINLLVVFGILFIHWIADFVLQTDKMARGKSKNWADLLQHTMLYTIAWFPAIDGYNLMYKHPIIFLFLPITFVCHTITDYYTSRLNAKLWEEKKVHLFFISIGFDQLLHYAQLFLTYYYLTK